MSLIRGAGLSRIRTQAFALGAIPVVFLLLLLSAVGVLRAQTENAAALVQHSDDVLGVERSLTSSLIRASVAVNGYVKRPDAAHKRTLQKALHIEPLARALQAMVRDDPAQERRAAAIAALTREFVDTYRTAAAAYAAHDLRRARQIANSSRSQGLSSAWTTQTSAFENAETALRGDRWAKLRAEYQRFGLVLAFGTVIAVGLTMLSAIAFGRRIVARIERLAAAARRAQSGQALPEVIEGTDEIAELDRAYHDMALAMHEREASLQKYHLLARNARDIILFIRRSDGRIVEANAAAAQAYGYSTEELARLNARDLRAPETLARLDAELDRAEASPLIFETVHRRKDGSVFPVEVAAQSVVIQGEALMVSIIRDISERRLAQQEVHGALKQAVQASRLKSEFLATMSHEIRTPLNAVIGMTELLLHSNLSADQERCAAVAHDSGEALLHLINDILDFSKIEAQRIDLEILEFKLVQVVEGAAGLFAPAAAQNRVALMTYVNPSIPQILLGDPGRLRQVLMNLTGNAVKFTHDGYVVITAELAHQDESTADVAFTVRDSGIGIAPEAIPALFEPFRQADGTMARRYGGTGLGLSISKGLVALMGGSIGVQSAVGAGSTFSFTLNFKRAQSQPLEPPNLSQMRALVVDDDPIAQDIFARYMTSWHMRCDMVGDPASACRLIEIAAADADPYDVILVDLVMPEMDGLEFARRIQDTIDLSHTRLIMVTAYDEPERGRTAIAAGFSAYLTKPVRQSQLYDCIVNASSGSTQESASSHSSEPHRGRRILVAEDNAINREVALRQLGKLGYAAQTVADGRQAVEAALSGQFDVVLMDCQMPVMDGFEATRIIRKGEARSGRRVRIVAMTANALAEDRQTCLDAGMDDYLPKPVTLNALQRVLAPDNVDGPLDIGRLNELFEGDRESMNEFLASALPALLRLVKRLEDAQQVHERLAAAHELKGAAANVGASEIAQIAADIEIGLRSNSDVAPLITRLFEAYERAVNGAHALEHQTT